MWILGLKALSLKGEAILSVIICATYKMYLACIVLTFKSMDGQNPMMQH